jgi:hypothetical protein
MGPVATKAMKGYSDEDVRSAVDEFKVNILLTCQLCSQYNLIFSLE